MWTTIKSKGLNKGKGKWKYETDMCLKWCICFHGVKKAQQLALSRREKVTGAPPTFPLFLQYLRDGSLTLSLILTASNLKQGLIVLFSFSWDNKILPPQGQQQTSCQAGWQTSGPQTQLPLLYLDFCVAWSDTHWIETPPSLFYLHHLTHKTYKVPLPLTLTKSG